MSALSAFQSLFSWISTLFERDTILSDNKMFQSLFSWISTQQHGIKYECVKCVSILVFLDFNKRFFKSVFRSSSIFVSILVFLNFNLKRCRGSRKGSIVRFQSLFSWISTKLKRWWKNGKKSGFNPCFLGFQREGKSRFRCWCKSGFNPCFLGFQQREEFESRKRIFSFNPCFLGFQQYIKREGSDLIISFNPCFLGFQPEITHVEVFSPISSFQSLFSWISTGETASGETVTHAVSILVFLDFNVISWDIEKA